MKKTSLLEVARKKTGERNQRISSTIVIRCARFYPHSRRNTPWESENCSSPNSVERSFERLAWGG